MESERAQVCSLPALLVGNANRRGGGAGGGDNVAKDGRGCVIVGSVDMQYS